jgi:hypothetical protein
MMLDVSNLGNSEAGNWVQFNVGLQGRTQDMRQDGDQWGKMSPVHLAEWKDDVELAASQLGEESFLVASLIKLSTM